ncbi:VapE domain-containing protein [Brucella sp. C7-11G]
MNNKNTIPTSGNVVTPNFNKPNDLQQEIIDSVRDMLANNEDIDVMSLALQTDLTSDMKKVRDYLVNGQFCSKPEWTAALKVSRVKRELGFYPQNVTEFVEFYVERENISVDFQKRMKSECLPTFEGQVITDEARKDTAVDMVARIQENAEINSETLKRDLRLIVSQLSLRFSAQEIDDAVSQWFDKTVRDRLQQVMFTITHDGSPNSQANILAWDAVCSQFDMEEHDAKFVKAILAKFIWQVKRKILNLPITNHLMPVINGPQGVGKSTFVTDYLLKPVEELVGKADFKMIEEVRNTEQWRNYVLFLDEMGYAGKADIDNVKNKITASTVTGRPMRSNDNVQYRQNATFIGCSNKELDQLIRDETGNRRFAALRYAKKPDWSKLKGIEPRLLWLSIDEHGIDPSTEVMDELRKRQEEAREKSVVEQWLDDHVVPLSLIGKKQETGELYKSYTEWAATYTPGRVIDSRMWGKEFNRLIKAGQITNWENLGRSNSKTHYQFNK